MKSVVKESRQAVEAGTMIHKALIPELLSEGLEAYNLVGGPDEEVR